MHRQLSSFPEVVNRFCSCGRLQARSQKLPFCRYFAQLVWATGLGHEPMRRAWQDNTSCLFAGTIESGSDGTRTRDLRRDSPTRVQRRPAKNTSEQPHLQALFALPPHPLRMVERIVRPTFGPRVGHTLTLKAERSNRQAAWPSFEGQPRCAPREGVPRFRYGGDRPDRRRPCGFSVVRTRGARGGRIRCRRRSA